MTIQELRDRIERINRVNNFDLAWKWGGNSDEPIIVIYEEADRHTLTAGTLDTIENRLTLALPAWGLTE